jgi:hypothetical protein
MPVPQKSRGISFITVFVVVSALCVAGWYLFLADPAVDRNGGPVPRKNQPVVIEDPQAVVKSKNVALALLENEKYTQSSRDFARLTKDAPNERLGYRNLLICRLLELESVDASQDPDRYARLLHNAQAALGELRRIETNLSVLNVLAARVALAGKDVKRAVQELAQTAQAFPNYATVWYELWLIGRGADDETQEQARDALNRTYRLAPTNLVVILDLLLQQAASRDDKVSDTLKQARGVLEPLAAGIKERTRADVLQQLDEAVEAAGAGDWPGVVRRVRILANVVRPEAAAKSDERRLRRHLMEYLLDDFSNGFYGDYGLARFPETSPVNVRLSVPSEGPSFPQMEGLQDAVLADFDLDGFLDVVVLSAGKLQVFARQDDQALWKVLSETTVPAGTHRLIVADLDNDFSAGPPSATVDTTRGEDVHERVACVSADVDVVVYGDSGVLLFENKLEAATATRNLHPVDGPPALRELSKVAAMTTADLDHDGDLDLLISSDSGLSFWSNRGGVIFRNVVEWITGLNLERTRITNLLPVDFDDDVDVDVVVVGNSIRTGLLENLRHGEFRSQTMEEWYQFLSMADAIRLIDGNAHGRWGFLAATPSGVILSRHRDRRIANPQEIFVKVVTDFAAHNLLIWDFDNNGISDFVAWNEQELHVYRGDSDASFQRDDLQIPEDLGGILTCDAGDVDNDGDWDLLVGTSTGLRLFLNEGGTRTNWIDVSLRAQQARGSESSASGRVNAAGIGSLLELKQGSIYQRQMVTRQKTHFGLGQRTRPDVIRVLWTNGIPQNIIQPEVNQVICETKALKGSCPYAYTWNGERFEFFTDLLWASPIGLQLAEGVLAPAREWEYLKLPGKQLAPIDGEYRLQITEELWEAAYFDSVKLMAVDHPTDVAVYTNEKVGPAEIAEHRIHTVREPRSPIAARDDSGRDVLPLIAHRDDRYLRGFEHRVCQGLVEEHGIEIDLGELADPGQITLFLTGWVFPTDTSINVALSQNSALPSPQPPSLWVPDENGAWRKISRMMGFPGGKTKTIAVDLSEAFLTTDFRVRILTNMEFYWDQVFFTMNETPADYRVTPLELTTADLHYRGFSRRIEHPGNGPESYDYNDVDVSPHWPPMEGNFTRYGDVTELLHTQDARLVVLSAGDEMTLGFRVPKSECPPGWQRDFVLHNVGWDKDADLNTIHGQTVEPLPFAEMESYPYAFDAQVPQTPEYRRYLQEYQTRRQLSPRFWNHIRHFQSGEFE